MRKESNSLRSISKIGITTLVLISLMILTASANKDRKPQDNQTASKHKSSQNHKTLTWENVVCKLYRY